MSAPLVRARLPFDPYHRAITFLHGTTEQINAALRRDSGDAEPNLTPQTVGKWICYTIDDREADYICVVRTGSPESRVATLAHECLHCAFHALRNAGVTLTWESEEAFTYYHQWLFSHCLRHLRGTP